MLCLENQLKIACDLYLKKKNDPMKAKFTNNYILLVYVKKKSLKLNEMVVVFS